MAKAFFRFLRGELNGFYLQSINSVMNSLSTEVKEFFIDFNNMQFEKGKIDLETLYNLGKFAGVSLPRVPQNETLTTLRMTESEYDEELNYEFSERGLYNLAQERFDFEQKVIDDSGLPDINTLATAEKRSSLVGTEEVQGYISEGEADVLDSEGNVNPRAVSIVPPTGKAYSDFYGDQFLLLTDNETTYVPISYEIFFELFKSMQYIRYNGTTLKALVEIINTLCPQEFVKITSVEVAESNTYFIIRYVTDFTVDIDLKQDRINMLLYIVKTKFPQVKLAEEL